MWLKEQTLGGPATNIIASFDLEWTKNYKQKNANKPFCFSFVYFSANIHHLMIEPCLDFGFISRYIEDPDELPELVSVADNILSKFLKNADVIVGHQLSSDIGVILNTRLPYARRFRQLKHYWRKRKERPGNSIRIFDTRYDINSLIQGTSRRLVDVCKEFSLDVTQPELLGSMTKMQNMYFKTRDISIMEKLSVLNLRHSLSSALLYYYYNHEMIPPEQVNVNRIVHRNLKQHYEYVSGNKFRSLL